MLEDIKKEFKLVRVLIILLTIAVGLYVFGLIWQILSNFSDLLIILLLSWLISFVLEPLVKKISLLTRLSKTISALIVYLFFFLILAATVFLFIPTVTSQIQSLSLLLPRYLKTSPQFINRFGVTLISYLNNSISIIPSVAQFFFSIFIILIFSFYLIIDKETILKKAFSITPKKWRETLQFTLEAIDRSFASFLHIQLIFGILSGFIAWFVLRILNIDFAASIALLTGIFGAIPLIGPLLAIIPPVVMAFIVDPAKAVLVFIILLIAQQFIFNALGPKLLGKAFQLHPIIIIISFLIGAKTAGVIGAFLAIPILGIGTLAIREITNRFSK